MSKSIIFPRCGMLLLALSMSLSLLPSCLKTEDPGRSCQLNWDCFWNEHCVGGVCVAVEGDGQEDDPRFIDSDESEVIDDADADADRIDTVQDGDDDPERDGADLERDVDDPEPEEEVIPDEFEWAQNTLSDSEATFVASDGVVFGEGGAGLVRAWSEWGPNLLINPGAEAGDIRGWVNVDDWKVDTSERHSGAYSFGELEECSDFEGRQHVDLTQYSRYILAGRARIAFEAWCETIDGDAGRVILEVLGPGQSPGAGHLWRHDTGNMDNDHVWRNTTAEITLPTDAVRAGVYLKGDYRHGSAASTWFDDMIIRVSTDSYATSGTFSFHTSAPFGVDWDRLHFEATVPEGTTLEAQVRTGPFGADDWHEWSVAENDQDLSELAGVEDGDRAIEVKFVLTSDSFGTPHVTSFTVSGLESL